MKWIAITAVTSAVFASSALAQDHIRCQNTIGGPCGDSSRPRAMNCCDYGYCQPWNSGYYQCLDKPAKCPTQETDIDYAGNDIKTLYGLQPNQCCDECAKTTNCKAYTFVNQNPDGKTACYLKTSAAGWVEKKGAVSGILIDAPPVTNCPIEEKDFDYFGNDISNSAGITQAECCDKCGVTTGCVAYTYVPSTKTCYLKSSAAGKVFKAGAVSGQAKTTPPPEKCPTEEKGFDYYGNDIKALFGGTQTECCDSCSTTTGCAVYTYIPATKACYLKKSDAGKVAKIGAVSGKLKDAPPPANCPVQENDVDYYGHDLKMLSGITNTECCDACSTLSGCAAYTFIAKGGDGKSACYLKSSAAGKIAKVGAVSSTLKCPRQERDACGAADTGALCCPSGTYCQPWNPAYYQCIPVPDVAKCPVVESGVDFYGGDLEALNGLSPSQCCDACFKNVNCKTFTFINFVNGYHSVCYLKTKDVVRRPRTDAVSGWLQGQAV